MEAPAQRPDTELREEIEQRLRWNVLIEDGLVNVSVKDGAITLDGVVGRLEEKRFAEFLARVAGLGSVDVSALAARRWADDESLRDNKYVRKSDEAVRQAVKDAALYDPRLLSFPIEPDVYEGWVNLRGTVENLKAKRAAERVARNTVGVFGVTNRLKVRPPSDFSEQAIAADIRARLDVNPITDVDDIEVAVDGGTVMLEGTSATRFRTS